MMVTESTNFLITIVTDYARVPGPRYKWQGKGSGEEFLQTLLEPRFLDAERAKDKLVVNLDGTEGYSTAFLDGSFGELGRKYGKQRVLATLVLITNDEPFLTEEIKKYMDNNASV